nr:MAG: non-structural polyprotein [Wufeng shrew hepevirus 1]
MERSIAKATQVAQERAAASLVQNAFTTSISLTREQAELINEFFAPQLVFSTYQKTSSHPIPAVLLEYSNKQAEHIRRIPGTIEWGGTPKAPGHSALLHNCCASTDLRDNARHVSRVPGVNDHDTNTYLSDLSESQEICDGSKKNCFNGIGHCNVTARQAVAVHSLYDITPEEVLSCMVRNKLMKVTAYLLLPPELHEPDLVYPDAPYCFKIIETNGVKQACMYFPGDTSEGYVHNHANWTRWATLTSIANLDAVAHVERVQNIGILSTIVITISHGSGHAVRTATPHSNQLCRFPDVVDALRTGKHNKKRDYVVNFEHLMAVILYGLTLQPKAFNQQTIVAYARSRMQNLSILGVVKTNTWKVTTAIKTAFMLNLFLYIFKERLIQAKQTSNFSGYLNRELSQYAECFPEALKCLAPFHFLSKWANFKRRLKYFLKVTVILTLYLVGSFIIVELALYDLRYLFHRPSRQTLACFFFQLLIVLVFIIIHKFFPRTPGTLSESLEENECFIGLSPKPFTEKMQETFFTHSPRHVRTYLNVLQYHNAKLPDHVKIRRQDFAGVHVHHKQNSPAKFWSYEYLYKDWLQSWRRSSFLPSYDVSSLFPDTLPIQPFNFDTTLFLGGPGVGKSTYIKNNFSNSMINIITPVRLLADEFIKEGFHAFTPHEALRQAPFGRVLAFDEAYLFHPGYIMAAIYHHRPTNVILLGDEKQIGFIDFEGNCETQPLPFDFYFPNLSYIEPGVTYRCPHDVTAWLNKNHGYKLKSASNEVNSVEFVKEFKHRPEATLITFTQEAKSKYGGGTVHQLQGQTFKHVDLVVSADANTLVSKSAAHVIVAVTRHTQSLHIYFEPGVDGKLIALSTEAFTALDLTGISAHTTINLREPELVMSPTSRILAKAAEFLSPIPIFDIMKKIIVTHPDIHGTVPAEFSSPATNVNITLDTFQNEEPVGTYSMNGPSLAHSTNAKDIAMTLYTVIERYAKKSKEISIDDAKLAADYMQRNLLNALFDISKIAKLERDEYNPESLLDHVNQLLVAQSNKGTNVEAFDNMKNFVVQFFMKQQSKVKTAPGLNVPGHFKGKAGQGVSAWSKFLNTLFGPYIRKFHDDMVRCLRDGVQISNGASDWMLSTAFYDVDENSNWIETDATEFDCNQGPITILLEARMFQLFGMPQPLIDLYVAIRTHWKMECMNVFSMYGTSKQHSGQPSTLTSNTLVAMALTACCIDGLETAVIGFKGDDTIVIGNEIKYNPTKADNLNFMTGIHLKVESEHPPQFINYFISKGGLVLDIVRTTAKLMAKTLKESEITYSQSKNWKISTSQAPKDAIVLTHDPDSDGLYVGPINSSCTFAFSILLSELKSTTLHVSGSIPVRTQIQLRNTAARYGKNIIHHTLPRPALAHLSELQQSITDRLSILHDEDDVRKAIITAATYYSLKEEEVESCYFFLRNFSEKPTVDVLRACYVEVKKDNPHVSFENVHVQPSTNPQAHFEFYPENCGSSECYDSNLYQPGLNRCADLCLRAEGLHDDATCVRIATYYATNSFDSLTEVAQILSHFTLLAKPFSILVTHNEDSVINHVLYYNVHATPSNKPTLYLLNHHFYRCNYFHSQSQKFKYVAFPEPTDQACDNNAQTATATVAAYKTGVKITEAAVEGYLRSVSCVSNRKHSHENNIGSRPINEHKADTDCSKPPEVPTNSSDIAIHIGDEPDDVEGDHQSLLHVGCESNSTDVGRGPDQSSGSNELQNIQCGNQHDLQVSRALLSGEPKELPDRTRRRVGDRRTIRRSSDSLDLCNRSDCRRANWRHQNGSECKVRWKGSSELEFHNNGVRPNISRQVDPSRKTRSTISPGVHGRKQLRELRKRYNELSNIENLHSDDDADLELISSGCFTITNSNNGVLASSTNTTNSAVPGRGGGTLYLGRDDVKLDSRRPVGFHAASHNWRNNEPAEPIASRPPRPTNLHRKSGRYFAQSSPSRGEPRRCSSRASDEPSGHRRWECTSRPHDWNTPRKCDRHSNITSFRFTDEDINLHRFSISKKKNQNLVFHFIHDRYKRPDGRAFGYSGFAGYVQNSVPGYVQRILRKKNKNGVYDYFPNRVIPTNIGNLTVLNIVSNAREFKDHLKQTLEYIAERYPGYNVHSPLVGTGLWNHSPTDVFNTISSSHSLFCQNSIRFTLHTKLDFNGSDQGDLLSCSSLRATYRRH